MTFRAAITSLFLLGTVAADQIRIDWRNTDTGNFAPINLTTLPDYVITFDANGSPIIGPAVGGVTDGDKGDIVVSGSGAAWAIDAGAISLAKLADLAQAKLIGRWTASTGVPEAITIGGDFLTTGGVLSLAVAPQPLDADLTYLAGFTPSANVKSLLNAADYAAMRTQLSLVPGTDIPGLATSNTFTGANTFSNITGTGTWNLSGASVNLGAISSSLPLAENSSIALDPAGSADGKFTGTTVAGTGGDTIAFGDLVTLDKDDSRWEKVDISVAAAATGDARGLIGIAVSSSTDGTAITVLLHGIIRADANFPALTIGAAVFASTTGDIVVTQPVTVDHVIRIIGWALTADEIFFNPDGTWTTHT